SPMVTNTCANRGMPSDDDVARAAGPPRESVATASHSATTVIRARMPTPPIERPMARGLSFPRGVPRATANYPPFDDERKLTREGAWTHVSQSHLVSGC